MHTALKLLIAAFLFLYTKAAAQSLADINKIPVLELPDSIPQAAKKIAHIKMKNTLFRPCDYNAVLQAVREKANKAGGSLVRITKMKQPGLFHRCYWLWADVYEYDHPEMIFESLNRQLDSLKRSLIPDSARYALIYLYRPDEGDGVLVSYNIHFDDEKVCRVSQNTSGIIKRYEEGWVNIWARTESRTERWLKIKFGEVYFLRCGVGIGVLVGHPTIRQETNLKLALREFEEVDYEVSYFDDKPADQADK